MPYLKKDDKIPFDAILETLPPIKTSGELNFCMTRLAQAYMEHHGLSYARLNDVNGAFIGAQQEFERRVVAPYEARKADENGDVYGKE